MDTEQAREITVASYNIHSCIGNDRINSPQRIIQVIREIDPDIIALQEVDEGYRIEFTRDQINELKALSGMDVHEGPTLWKDKKFFGNVIMTKWPVDAIQRHDISVKGFEPRGIIEAGMVIYGVRFRFISTHLGLNRIERRYQAGKLADILTSDTFSMTAVAGDFNEWLPCGHTAGRLRGLGGRSVAALSFPSRFPLFPLDRLWFFSRSGYRDTVVDSGIHFSRLSRVASDHLPIYARVDLSQFVKE